MTKRKKKQRKRRKPRKQHQPAPQVWAIPQDLIAGMEEVDRLTGRKQWPKALEKLQELDQHYPNQPAILIELVNVCYELKDIRSYQFYCEQLFKFTPNDHDLMLGLAGAYMTNMYPALALQTFRRFLEQYPDHERVNDVRQTISDLETGLQEALQEFKLKYKDPFQVAAWHDELRLRSEQAQLKEARQIANRLLQLDPDFTSVLNNLSLVELMEGRLEQAIKNTHRVLTLDPTNFQALGNLVRCYVMQGEFEAAQLEAEKLKQVEDASPELWLKRAEAFTYLGDDRAVLETLQAAKEAGHLEPLLANPMLYHFAAVAAMRLGDEEQGRQYWQKTLELNPNFELARANLADLQKPVHERHAPWPFGLRQWISERAASDMVKQWEAAIRRNSDQAMTRAARRYLKQHPQLMPLLPLLFERGDPAGREFAFDMVRLAKTDDLLALLPDFALGQYGPDGMRYKALHIAREAGLIPEGTVRMWLKGRWQEIVLFDFEIHDQPVKKHLPQVEDWAAEAAEALQRNDGTKAEQLLKQALDISPDEPSLLNNLAMAYSVQGRQQESKALLRQIHRDHPDYFFGRVGMANLYLQEGSIEQADALLYPLLSQQRMHISEFTALAVAYIQLFLAKDAPEAAQHWLDMWVGIDPNDPELRYWQRQVRLHHSPKKSGWRKRLGF